ncbi:response regulator [Desulfuromonas acetoxidans]|uniref:response regulator n=1 Tax=Desulfuromonas acetoxidans TaxID=891 RepID=UPI000053B28C|nr:response regulator [Desulfuromonas acetoxidans]MBF0645300.1 response regulator [Desulfuromonas acetoxidans]NVD25821.1 response regulator [Desulfuromonas acetoxidans]NVE17799.1 response regulator [Desulfuromonas acetoxidans]
MATILIADDDNMTRNLLELNRQDKEHQVTGVSNGEKALKKLQTEIYCHGSTGPSGDPLMPVLSPTTGTSISQSAGQCGTSHGGSGADHHLHRVGCPHYLC